MNIPATTIGKHEAAADRHHGRIVNISKEHLLLISDVSGEKQYVIAPDVKATVAGKVCDVEEFKPGDIVFLTVRKDDESRVLEIASAERDE